MPKHARFFWSLQSTNTFNLSWTEINHDSVVVITASEGQQPITNTFPQRFVGSARFSVANVAPRDGGVVFHVVIDWHEPLNLWTDITVFDSSERPAFGKVPFEVR